MSTWPDQERHGHNRKIGICAVLSSVFLADDSVIALILHYSGSVLHTDNYQFSVLKASAPNNLELLALV